MNPDIYPRLAKQLYWGKCENSYTREEYLQEHTKVYVKPKSSKICYKPAKSVCEYKSHSKRHLERSAFDCIFCERIFNWLQCLDLHIRWHTCERPFFCSKWQAAFRRQYNLSCHLKRRHATPAKLHRVRPQFPTSWKRKHLSGNKRKQMCKVQSKYVLSKGMQSNGLPYLQESATKGRYKATFGECAVNRHQAQKCRVSVRPQKWQAQFFLQKFLKIRKSPQDLSA